MRRIGVVAAGAAVTMVSGLGLGGCAAEDDSSTPAPKRSATAEGRSAEGRGEEPEGGRAEEAGGERGDLVSFEIEDRSQAGFENIWVT
ncbi:hypothetical protein ABZX82_00455 [Streptomyces griseoflavus]|uniref:hypothetical protein n=1 Tax=Streptomyces griseoflavus TaxID=35619 RepID=UPI0033B40837